MTHERTQYLLTRYISNSITKEELEELKIQINISDDEKVLYELSAPWENHPIEHIQDPSILREALKIIEINTHTNHPETTQVSVTYCRNTFITCTMHTGNLFIHG